MILHLTRYFGSPNITKSIFTISDTGRTLMTCEAREPPFSPCSDVCTTPIPTPSS